MAVIVYDQMYNLMYRIIRKQKKINKFSFSLRKCSIFSGQNNKEIFHMHPILQPHFYSYSSLSFQLTTKKLNYSFLTYFCTCYYCYGGYCYCCYDWLKFRFIITADKKVEEFGLRIGIYK